MHTEVKIVLVGAGSAQFAYHVAMDLCLTPGLWGSQVVLVDIDPQRLSFMDCAVRRLSEELKAGLRVEKTREIEKALPGADFVINSVQVGGNRWLEEQRAMAERHGYYRGANLHEFGQMQFFLELMRKMERFCPNAWHIQAANPVFEGGSLIARSSKIKSVGLCHGFFSYLKMADILGLEREYLSADAYGFNHWLWLKHFRYKGEDAYPLIDDWIANKAEAYWNSPHRLQNTYQLCEAAVHQYRLFGLVPIGDTPRHGGWWYHNSLKDKKRWFDRHGGMDSEIGWPMHMEKCENNLRQIRKAALDAGTPLTEALGVAHSTEQIVPIIQALVNNERGIYQVNLPNKGRILPDFPEDVVIESKAVVDSSGIRLLPVEPLPRRLVVDAMIPRWHYAELKLEVMRSREKQALLVYLLRDHRTQNLAMAEGLMNEWLAHPNNQHLGIH